MTKASGFVDHRVHLLTDGAGRGVGGRGRGKLYRELKRNLVCLSELVTSEISRRKEILAHSFDFLAFSTTMSLRSISPLK